MTKTAKMYVFPAPPKPAPSNEIGTNKVKKAKPKTRYLREDQVERLMAEARKGRNGFRDQTMILIQYRHGYRSAEMVYCDKAKGSSGLLWDDIDFKNGYIRVRRLKGSIDSVQPLQGDELRALRRLQRESDSPYVFTSKNGSPVSREAYRKLIARLGRKAGFDKPIGTHQLRHGTGFYLVNNNISTRIIQAYLGHTSISNTVRYTELSADKFKDIWTKKK